MPYRQTKWLWATDRAIVYDDVIVLISIYVCCMFIRTPITITFYHCDTKYACRILEKCVTELDWSDAWIDVTFANVWWKFSKNFKRCNFVLIVMWIRRICKPYTENVGKTERFRVTNSNVSVEARIYHQISFLPPLTEFKFHLCFPIGHINKHTIICHFSNNRTKN